MPDKTPSVSGAMEGGGAYNRYAAIPASGGASALPHWEKAVLSVPLGNANRPVVIADYGSSQGKNSCAPVQIAINALRSRLGQTRPIMVHHIDIPANDFNALFEVLETDPGRYAADDPQVFSSAIARSFYETVLPAEQVDLGWSAYSAMWPSRVPSLIPGHFCVLGSTGSIRVEFERQFAHDWETFLTLRSAELRFGGRLVVVVPTFDGNGRSGFEDFMDHGNAVLASMVEEHAITADERKNMVLGAGPRSKNDLIAPFAANGHFRGLTVEHCETAEIADPAWDDYRRDGDREAVACRQAAFFRSTFAPTLALALTTAHDHQRVQGFSGRLEQGLRHRLARDPAPVHSLAATIVLAKR